MFDCLDDDQIDERKGRKRQKREGPRKYSEREGVSAVGTFPMFKKRIGRDLWLQPEDSGYAQFSGERLFEGQRCVRHCQQQLENGIKTHATFPENEHVVKGFQLRRKKKTKKIIEEDKVVNSCRANSTSDSTWIDSVRTCMQACLQEVAESRNQILRWMREEIQSFLYRQTLTSGFQLAFSAQGNAYGSPEFSAANMTFESQGGRDTALSFEGHDYAFPEHGFGSKTESMKNDDTFPDVAGVRCGKRSDGMSFGGQNAGGRGTHMEVQPSGSLGEMRFTAQSSQACALNIRHTNGIPGPSIAIGGSSVHDLTRGSNYAFAEFAQVGSLKSSHAHILENSFGLHVQNSLNVAKVHGATSGVQNPITLGMMWNVMHHNMVGFPGTGNHGRVNCTFGMANKTTTDVVLRTNTTGENQIAVLSSSPHNGSYGMQLPLALQVSSPAGTAQSFESIPTSVGMQTPVDMPNFINMGMSASTGHMSSVLNGQFAQIPTLSECSIFEKSTAGQESLVPASAEIHSQNFAKIRFSNSTS